MLTIYLCFLIIPLAFSFLVVSHEFSHTYVLQKYNCKISFIVLGKQLPFIPMLTFHDKWFFKCRIYITPLLISGFTATDIDYKETMSTEKNSEVIGSGIWINLITFLAPLLFLFENKINIIIVLGLELFLLFFRKFFSVYILPALIIIVTYLIILLGVISISALYNEAINYHTKSNVTKVERAVPIKIVELKDITGQESPSVKAIVKQTSRLTATLIIICLCSLLCLVSTLFPEGNNDSSLLIMELSDKDNLFYTYYRNTLILLISHHLLFSFVI